MSETGERLMVFCDQNNPTFSLDAASLQQVMGVSTCREGASPV